MATDVVIAYKISEFFGASADPSTITLPVPNVSPGAPAPNRASFDTGFPTITFTPLASGGQPPSGKDFNGVLFMLSQYALSMQAGQAVIKYDAAIQTALGGYPKSAMLTKATGVGFWVSTVDANMTDPDTGGANWQDFSITPSGTVTDAPAAGATNDYNPTGNGPTIGFYMLTPAGIANITGLLAGFHGQIVIVANLAVTTLTLNALNAGSAAANRFLLPADLVLAQNQTQAFRYNSAVALWIPM